MALGRCWWLPVMENMHQRHTGLLCWGQGIQTLTVRLLFYLSRLLLIVSMPRTLQIISTAS